MTGFGVHTLVCAWLFALLAPLIVFYFLKLRRPRHNIPSLALWKRVIEDRRVNSPFQRFKRNILLLLQILLLCLLVLAAMRPFFSGAPSRVSRLPVLIDCSGSMGALDKLGGSTRLEAAKAKIAGIIDGMGPDQRICLLAVDNGARRITDFTDNRRLLHQALEDLQVRDVPSDLEEAMRMTAALAREYAFGDILLVSDGNLPEQVNATLSFEVDYQLVPPAGSNTGIVAMNARRASGGEWDVFVQVATSAKNAPSTATLVLLRDGTEVASEELSVIAEHPERMVFRIDGADPCQLTAQLEMESFDSLASDNVAFLNLPALRKLLAYVPEHLATYAQALATIPFVSTTTDPTLSALDIAVVDVAGKAPDDPSVLVTLGQIPEPLKTSLTSLDEPTEIVDWTRESDLLRYVRLREVTVLEQPALTAGVRIEDVENAGYEVLAEGARGPMILRRDAGRTLAFHFLFHTDRSTLPYRVAFPILIANIVEIAANRAGLSEIDALATGAFPPLRSVPSCSFTVTGPGNSQQERASDADGVLAGLSATRAGLYTITSETGSSRTLGASMLNERETRLARVEELMFKEELTVQATTVSTKVEKPLWRLLALLAFAAMLLEWWWYQRKAG